jgi:hypothetical protein
MKIRAKARWACVSALALTALIVPAGASSAMTLVAAPTALHVARTGAGSDSLTASWGAVAGIDHYAVTIFDGSRDVVHIVPAGRTSATFPGSGSCAHYRVTVAAVMPDGTTAATAPYLLGSLAPGGISKVTAARSDSGATGTVTWAAPSSSNGVAAGYHLSLTQISTGAVVASRTVSTTSLSFTGLLAARTYIAKVTPYNAFGSCSTGTIVLGNQIPTSPGALTVARSAGAPGTAVLGWGSPAWAGYGPVTSYLVGYGRTSTPTTWVRSSTRSLSVAVDPTVSWVFRVRTVNGSYVSSMGAPIILKPVGAPGTPVVDPAASVTATDTGVRVSFASPVVSSTLYPRVTVAVAPTLSTGTFRESHVVTNGAGAVDFTDVPCGVYTVTATGSGAGTVKEFARTVLDRCNTGLMTTSSWKLISGQATFTDQQVSLPYGFVLSTKARTGQDAVVTTEATFTSGMGYGVLVHASANATAGVSAFSVQYDHGWGDYFVLRQWDNGNECTVPLATSRFPAGLSLTATHHFVAVAVGDSLDVTLDGIKVFTVPSLSKSVAGSPCHFPMPSGTGVGFRSWGSAGNVTFVGTTLN